MMRIRDRVVAEYLMECGKKIFKVTSDEPNKTYRSLRKLFKKRGKKVRMTKEDDGVWVRRME